MERYLHLSSSTTPFVLWTWRRQIKIHLFHLLWWIPALCGSNVAETPWFPLRIPGSVCVCAKQISRFGTFPPFITFPQLTSSVRLGFHPNFFNIENWEGQSGYKARFSFEIKNLLFLTKDTCTTLLRLKEYMWCYFGKVLLHWVTRTQYRNTIPQLVNDWRVKGKIYYSFQRHQLFTGSIASCLDFYGTTQSHFSAVWLYSFLSMIHIIIMVDKSFRRSNRIIVNTMFHASAKATINVIRYKTTMLWCLFGGGGYFSNLLEVGATKVPFWKWGVL